ncbi:MAG TPA: GGDEF domain-containing protein [Myxococcales bacterium]|nr:GGDEF domain-containing protein [Myxococcales bacterium]HIN86377.1 GGDEF domain-containing protein [Myxococcales bacterium]
MGDAKTRITTVKGISATVAPGNECLVVIYGGTLGQKYELSDHVVSMGRDPDNSIIIDVDSVSRRHARIETFSGSKYLVDLNSTNGTYLNDNLAVREQLSNGDFIKVGDTIFKFLSGADIERSYHEEIYTMTVTDGLTQVPNKRLLLEYLEREFSRARRYERNLSCVMFDIDLFKNINDEYGHLTGDFILKELAQIVARRIRKEEIFARYGGEEFAIVLPECKEVAAVEFAESIRSIVELHSFDFENNIIPVTISLGVGHIREAMAEPSDLLKAADQNLYKAKRAGRNQVCG